MHPLSRAEGGDGCAVDEDGDQAVVIIFNINYIYIYI